MSLVSSIISGISQTGGQGLGAITGFNLNDTEFSNILDKEMNKKIDEGVTNILGSLGIPAGFDFEQVNLDDLVTAPIEKSAHKLMNFAQRHAANLYNRYSGDVVTNLSEFVSDALKLG